MSIVGAVLGRVPWLGTALQLAPWVIAAAGVGGALWYRGEWKDCQASVAIDAARAEEKVRAQRDADAKFTRSLAEQLKPITTAIQEQSDATQVALAKVRSDPNCARTPAAAAFDAGVVPQRGQQAGPGAARPARP